ncbi:MAG: NAD-dependent epimerase/dehydratase family protein [Candidatus Aenigmarchaeota archaeon]|nr:NAD-dependent epimerase/dehydratase family protein [Candidatus Aenigmarchaeota archaeon]
MKILVTGGAGFIGSNTVDMLVDAGHEVSVIDNFFSGRKENLNEKVEIFEENILKKDKIKEIIEKTQPESVLHLAATVSPLRSVKNPLLDAQINIEGTLSLYSALAETIEQDFLKRIVVASSQAAYGEGNYECEKCGWKGKPDFRTPENIWKGKFDHFCPKCGYYPVKPISTKETMRQDPSMPYGVSKLAEEKYLLSFAQSYGINGIALRYFNVYGQRQTSQGMETAVSAIFFNKLLHNEQPLAFEDGKQTRDFVHVNDIATVNKLSLEKAKGIKRYNVGGTPISIAGLAEKIADAVGVDKKPIITNEPRYAVKGRGTIDTRHCFADMSLVKEDLGFESKVSLEDGLKQTAEWSKENKDIL